MRSITFYSLCALITMTILGAWVEFEKSDSYGDLVVTALFTLWAIGTMALAAFYI